MNRPLAAANLPNRLPPPIDTRRQGKTGELAGIANFAHQAVPDSVPAAAGAPDSLSPPASSGPTPVAGTIVDRIVDDAPSGLLNVFAGRGEQRDDPFSAR
jgi:hypothetical protein